MDVEEMKMRVPASNSLASLSAFNVLYSVAIARNKAYPLPSQSF